MKDADYQTVKQSFVAELDRLRSQLMTENSQENYPYKKLASVRQQADEAAEQTMSGSDEAAAKERGLSATKSDTVGFWDRLRAGNIDDPGSEAYKKWGAGADPQRTTASTTSTTTSTAPSPAPSPPPSPPPDPAPAPTTSATTAEKPVAVGAGGYPIYTADGASSQSFRQAYAQAKPGSTFTWAGADGQSRSYAKPAAPAPKPAASAAPAPTPAASAPTPAASAPTPAASAPTPAASAPTPATVTTGLGTRQVSGPVTSASTPATSTPAASSATTPAATSATSQRQQRQGTVSRTPYVAQGTDAETVSAAAKKFTDIDWSTPATVAGTVAGAATLPTLARAGAAAIPKIKQFATLGYKPFTSGPDRVAQMKAADAIKNVGTPSSTGGSTFSAPGSTIHKAAQGREAIQQQARAAQSRSASTDQKNPSTVGAVSENSKDEKMNKQLQKKSSITAKAEEQKISETTIKEPRYIEMYMGNKELRALVDRYKIKTHGDFYNYGSMTLDPLSVVVALEKAGKMSRAPGFDTSGRYEKDYMTLYKLLTDAGYTDQDISKMSQRVTQKSQDDQMRADDERMTSTLATAQKGISGMYENKINEATKETGKGRIHKADPGGYGRKIDTDEEGEEKKKDKPAVKRGRGRPKKNSDSDTGEVKKWDTDELSKWIIGSKPKTLPGKASKKHKIKDESMNESFADWDNQLSTLLNEGLTITTSTGQPGGDSVSVSATDAEAQELMKLLQQAGMTGAKTSSAMSVEPAQEPTTMIIEPVASDEVIADLSSTYDDSSEQDFDFIKRMLNVRNHGDQEEKSDYKDEELCADCGHSECECPHVSVEEDMVKMNNHDVEEGNEFTGARQAAIDSGKSEFEVDGKKYKVTGDTSGEKKMKKESALDQPATMEEEMCAECGSYMTEGHQCETKELNEWANSPVGHSEDEEFRTEIDYMTKMISGGLNNMKQDQTVMPHTKVKVSEASDDLTKAIKALAGIK